MDVMHAALAAAVIYGSVIQGSSISGSSTSEMFFCIYTGFAAVKIILRAIPDFLTDI